MATPAPQLRNYTKEYGASGTQIYSGIITGEEYNRNLQGHYALKQYDIMARSDADVHATLEVCKQPLIAAAWDVKAARMPDGKIDPKDQAIADQVKYELFHHNIDFDDLLYQALDMLDFGFSVFEKVYEPTTYLGKPAVGLAKIAFRKQTTIYAWKMKDGKTPGVTQQLPTEICEIPMDRILVFTNKRRGENYEGISLLRYVYKDWDMKDKLTLVNAMALEKMAVGVPKISVRDGQSAAPGDIAKAEKSMRAFRANEEGFISEPGSITVEMLDMKGNTTKEVIPTLQYHKRAIFTSVMATFFDLGGSSGSGAKSLSSDLTSFFLKAEEYVAKTIRSAINQQLIKQLVDLNYSPENLPNGYPELTTGNIADDDITALADATQKFMSSGALTADAEMEDVFRSKLGLPAMPEDLKKSYEDRRKAAEDAKNKIQNQLDPNADPNADPAADPVTPKKIKKDAAARALNADHRTMIDVIFADED